MGLLERIRGKPPLAEPVRLELPVPPPAPSMLPHELARQVLAALSQGDRVAATSLCHANRDLVSSMQASRDQVPAALAANAEAGEWYRRGVELAVRFCAESLKSTPAAATLPPRPTP